MKYRKYDWLNFTTKQLEYGIQAQPAVGDKWHNCAEGKVPCIYKTEAERDAKIKQWRKEARDEAKETV